MFKPRPYDCIPVCRSVPQPYVPSDITANRAFSVRERGVLHPKLAGRGRQDSVTVEVVAVDGPRLSVRAAGGYALPNGDQLIEPEAVFGITSDVVWAATQPD